MYVCSTISIPRVPTIRMSLCAHNAIEARNFNARHTPERVKLSTLYSIYFKIASLHRDPGYEIMDRATLIYP